MWKLCTTRPNGSSTHCPRSWKSGSTRHSDSRRTIRTATRSRMRISSGLPSRQRQTTAQFIERSEDLPDNRGKCEALSSELAAEEPTLQRLQQLAACERLHLLGATVALRDAEVVLERTVRRFERVVELIALEEVVVSPRLVTRAVLGVNRPAHRPERALLALEPD